MADFSTNHDDGAIFLPANVLLGNLSTMFFPSGKTYMEEVSQEISSFSLFEHNPTNRTMCFANFYRIDSTKVQFPLNHEMVIPHIQFGSFVSLQTEMGSMYNGEGSDVFTYGGNVLRTRSGSFFQFPSANPLQTQVEPEWGARIVQNQAQIMFRPVQVFGYPLGGLFKGSRGTGVFIPRARPLTDVSNILVDDKKKEDGKNHSRKTEEHSCGFPMAKPGMGKKNVTVGKTAAVWKKTVGLKAPAKKGSPHGRTY